MAASGIYDIWSQSIEFFVTSWTNRQIMCIQYRKDYSQNQIYVMKNSCELPTVLHRGWIDKIDTVTSLVKLWQIIPASNNIVLEQCCLHFWSRIQPTFKFSLPKHLKYISDISNKLKALFKSGTILDLHFKSCISVISCVVTSRIINMLKSSVTCNC